MLRIQKDYNNTLFFGGEGEGGTVAQTWNFTAILQKLAKIFFTQNHQNFRLKLPANLFVFHALKVGEVIVKSRPLFCLQAIDFYCKLS